MNQIYFENIFRNLINIVTAKNNNNIETKNLVIILEYPKKLILICRVKILKQ